MSRESYALGAAFEQYVTEVLEYRRWTIDDRNVNIDGIEVDIVAHHPGIVDPWFIECKGGVSRGTGLARTDTVKKAVGAAWALRDSPVRRQGRYWLVGSLMPSERSAAHTLLRSAVDAALIDGVGTVSALVTFADALTGEMPDGFARRPCDG